MATPIQIVVNSGVDQGLAVPLTYPCGYIKIQNTDATNGGWVTLADVNNGDSIVPYGGPPSPPTNGYYLHDQWVPPGGSVEYDWMKGQQGNPDPLGAKMTHILFFTHASSLWTILAK